MELKQVKENVRKMVSLGAPEEDIDGYIAAAGYTVEDVKNYQAPQYSALEKAVYTGRAGAEGLLFGLGDVLAGATNTVMSPLAKTVNALKEGTPLSMQDFNPVKNFQEGRGDFVREQEDFKKEHPGLNTTGEVLGGLVTGIGGAGKVAGAKALGKLGKWGTAAATGAGSGALWGFGNGLTRGDQELSLTQGAKEALPGAFLGGAFGIAAPAALGAAGKAANLINRNNRAFRKVAQAAGDDLQKSIDTQTPLLNIGNSKVAKLGKTAKRNNEKAGDLLDEFVEQGYAGQGDKLRQIVSKYMPATGAETAETLTAAKRALSEAAYKPMQQMGDLASRNPSLSKIVAESPQIQEALAIVRKNVPQLKNLPDTDFYLLNEAKKMLDYMSSRESHNWSTPMNFAKDARAKLINALDKATGGQYKKALKDYGDLLGAEQALSRGRELMNMDPQAAAEVYRQAGKAEREAMRVGLAQELQRRIRKGSIDGSARNLASTLVGSEQNKQIFRSVLGKDADKFIEELSGVNRAVKNYGIVKGGSDTAENLMLGSQSINFLKHPVEGAVNLVGRGLDWLTGLNQEQVAHMLIDPGYAAVMRAKAGALPPSAYIDISGAGGAFANIAGPLTKKEGNVYRNQVQQKLINNKALSRRAVNKMVGSSADVSKVGILENLEKIAAQKPTYTIKANTPTYTYEIHPVQTKYGPDAAVVTKKDGHIYNANPWKFFEEGYRKKVSKGWHGYNPRPMETKTSVAGDPSTKRGITKGTNSIPNKPPKNKTGKNALTLRDLIILLNRPFTLGAEGNIAKQNLQEGN